MKPLDRFVKTTRVLDETWCEQNFDERKYARVRMDFAYPRYYYYQLLVNEDFAERIANKYVL